MLATALNEHFAGTGPESWRVCAPTSNADPWRWQRLLREVRQQSLPEWHRVPLVEITRQTQLAKDIPRSLDFLLPAPQQSDLDPLRVTEKRQRIKDVAEEERNPSSLPGLVWKRLRITTQSLPHHLRLGVKPR